MTLTVEFQEHDEYIHAEIKGTFVLSDLLELFEKTLLYSSVKKIFRILFDCRGIEGELPLAEIVIISKKTDHLETDYSGFTLQQMNIVYLINEEVYRTYRDNVDMVDEGKGETHVTSDPEQVKKWLFSKEN